MERENLRNCGRKLMETIHIFPVDEEPQHELQHIYYPFCKCLPTEEIVNGNLIITHQSFDGRESLEKAKEILNGL